MRIITILILVLATNSLYASEFSYSVDRNGLPLLKSKGHQIAVVKMLFWGPKWSWATPHLRKGPNSKNWHGKSNKLNMNAVMVPVKALKWKFEFDVKTASPKAIGGGLEFKLNAKANLEKAKLLPGNTGWTAGGIKVTFSPALAKVYFERGNKNIIRCMFYHNGIPAGKKSFKMNIDLAGGGKRIRSLSERYGKVNSSKWFKNALHPTKAFVDLSYMNHKPAGKFGMVKTHGDKFIF